MRALRLLVSIPVALMALSPQGDYSLSGVVRNSVTGEPVKGAVVTLFKMPDTFDRPPSQYSAVAGPNGEYSFTGLMTGNYSVSAQKPGFMAGSSEPDDRGIIEVPSTHAAAIKLTPLGVIEGTMVNQYGDPMRNVSVQLFQSQVMDGERTTTPQRPTKVTDDLGHFRFYDLAPGKYYVKAMNRAGGTSQYVGENAVRYDSWEGFRPVYFGGAPLMESATPVLLELGTQARADFKLSVEPTYKIRGSLENFAPHQATAVFELLETDDNVAASRVSLNADTGRFEIDDVPTGQYTLRVTQGRLSRGEVRVAVNGGDTNGVSVGLVPAVTVTGSVRVDGARNSKEVVEFVNRFHTRPMCNISLRSGTQQSMPMGVPLVGNGPEFTIPNVFAGQYEVRINCFGGYASSALAGGAGLLAEPTLTVSPGVVPPPIEITLKPGGGSAHAKLPDSSSEGQPALLLVPTFSSTGPVIAFGMMITQLGDAEEANGFGVGNLAPGDYLAYALADANSVEYRNPTVLRNLGGGVSVRIEDGKTTEIALTSWVK
jgi:hypothetical protein